MSEKEMRRAARSAALALDRAQREYDCALAVEDALNKAFLRANAATSRAAARLDAAEARDREAMVNYLLAKVASDKPLDTPPETG